MDKVQRTFDEWARNGRSELMEKEHSKAVLKFLGALKFKEGFTFLDVGCGNGWVVRKISALGSCKKAVGIDKSKNMIQNAIQRSSSSKEKFVQTDIESWTYKGKFDYVFSMESLYYSDSVEKALRRIYNILMDGGQCFCGTDFYKDNKATASWAKKMGITMHLYFKAEWKKLFEDAGFTTRTKNIKDLQNSKKWKREFGTLFIIGTK